MKKLLLLITLLFTTSTFAEELEKYDFQWMHVPVVCGTTPEVTRYLENNNFKLESVSMGRAGASETGDPAYFVAYYLNEKGDQSISAITSPTGAETCMMYRSFDMRVPGALT